MSRRRPLNRRSTRAPRRALKRFTCCEAINRIRNDHSGQRTGDRTGDQSDGTECFTRYSGGAKQARQQTGARQTADCPRHNGQNCRQSASLEPEYKSGDGTRHHHHGQNGQRNIFHDAKPRGRTPKPYPAMLNCIIRGRRVEDPYSSYGGRQDGAKFYASMAAGLGREFNRCARIATGALGLLTPISATNSKAIT